MNKHEREHRLRGLRKSDQPGGEGRMRFVGIDIGGERHAVAVVKDDGALLVRSKLFGEEAAGYQRLHESPGRSPRLLGSDGGNGALLAQFVRLPGWAWFQGGTP